MPAVPCMMIRGGSSRGLYFLRDDLPRDVAQRDAQLLRAIGGPDSLQIDGAGGGHPLTNKVAILNTSAQDNVDVDYLFLQADAQKQTLSDAQNCGNILAGVGLFAVARGLVDAVSPSTTVRVRMLNSGALCHLELPTPGGMIETIGDTTIDGVPGSSAPIVCNYLEIAGATCGALLPTGSAVDEIEGARVTCIDNGMPVVVLAGADLGVGGDERPEALDSNVALKARLESIRLLAGPLMHLGDVTNKSVPKMCIVSAPTQRGLINTRTFIPHVCHKTIGVLGAVSVATACLLPGAPVAQFAVVPDGNPKIVDVEHPEGGLQLQLAVDEQGHVVTAGVVRTGRVIFDGRVFV